MTATDIPRRRWFSYLLRTLFVAITSVACMLFLLIGAPNYLAVPFVLLFSAAYFVALLVGIAYSSKGCRAFCIGAVVPAAGYFLGIMNQLTSAMIRVTPMFEQYPSVRAVIEGFGSGPHFRTWFAITLGVSLLMGLVASMLVRFLSKAEPPAPQL